MQTALANAAAIEAAIASLNSGLNAGQRRAAETTDGPVMVIAGAGAGKTKATIHRTATLLRKGVPASNILVVTFTNKAAEEIKARLVDMEGENGDHVVAGTFHSIIFRRILQRFPDSAYLRAIGIDMTACAILDDSETGKLLKEAMKELSEEDLKHIEDNEWTLSTFERMMSEQRAQGFDVYDFMAVAASSKNRVVLNGVLANLWQIYTHKCRQVNGIDFDDILVVAAKLLKQEPAIAQELGREFRYVMLDEYQDTNPVQMMIMDAIVREHRNLFVVGDEKQSIYKFRGSDIRVIMNFRQRYPEAVQIDLTENYRCNPEIIRVANACADAMTQRLNHGQLGAVNPNDYPALTPTIVEFNDDRAEAEMIARAIRRDLARGIPGREIAVLYRNRSLKIALERRMVDMNLPYQLVNDTSFYQRAEIKDLVAMIRFVFHPWDSMAGLRFMDATRFGVSANACKKAMSEKGINTHEYLRQQAERTIGAPKKGEAAQPSAAARKLKPFLGLCKTLRESAAAGDHADLIVDTLERMTEIFLLPKMEMACKRATAADGENNFAAKQDNLTHILDRMREKLAAGHKVDQVIEDLAMMVEQSPVRRGESDLQVRLMTMHASKGLEFDHVYLIGVDSESCGYDDESLDETEEMRRLLYVGITRGKKKVTISYAMRRQQHGEIKSVMASPFLEEIQKRTGIKTLKPDTPAPGVH